MKINNRILSIIIFLIMLLVALFTVGGKIEGNIIQIAVTIMLYIGIVKFIIAAITSIQTVANEVETIIDKNKIKG